MLFALLKLVTGILDHFLVAHRRQAERADPSSSAVPLACMGESRSPAAPSALHACDGICEWTAAHAARGAKYDRPRPDRLTGRGRGCRASQVGCVRSEGAVKRRGSPSGSVQEKIVAFEANEGGTDDDEVKHYDADGACARSRCAVCSLVY
jgi:hypothetical protein